MKRFLGAVLRIDITFHAIAGSVLAFMMVVTLLDIIMRNLGRPIVGSMEIISFCGSVVVGFAIPYTSWKKAHVYVDFLLVKLSPGNRRIMEIITRCMGIALFAFIGYNFILYGFDLIKTKEVSPSFKLPYYPIPFGLSLSCFLQCLTLIADLLKTVQGGKNE
ncbi:MAG TPA: TRAP transporter small permease [Syntrophorhabdaceae bacterium]|nr:TRAP transporter small permease [Syntrophorhabdaceae bacterium]HNT69194.1 TRAP transporter small permease [Syntrophorhabdaceae bacterium]